ncbi:SRPBCC family protein [Fodinicola feengrottensis]|uniref:SRPBCC family protein n=1 Tax=Fodinicola feengrottensis TaxID=435914 RepID=UPI0036F3FD1E
MWDAIATGPGMSSWFMGPHEIDPAVGGKIKLTIGDFSEQSTITAWDPPKHLAYETTTGDDGSFHAMEYLLEAKDGGSTVLRFVHSGRIGPEWGDEYVDMTTSGWDFYLHTLGQYVRYFAGRPGTYVYAQLPKAPDGTDPWSLLVDGLGLTEPLRVGDPVRMAVDGLDPIDGVVDYTIPQVREVLGIRGKDALYRFHSSGAIGHHCFGADAEKATKAWQDTLNRVYR